MRQYRDDFSCDENGSIRQFARIGATIASDALLNSLAQHPNLDIPVFEPNDKIHFQLANWILSLSDFDRKKLGLDQELPPKHIHYVRGATNLFYDLRNTDIILEELDNVGVRPTGKLLDFGCSSGRNIATLNRCFGAELDLYGVDPAQSSIDWARQQFPFANFTVNNQEPPLAFAPESFDLVVAKSIWTHFSASAAKKWFREIARVMKKGAHFFFSVHGPHDIAYRLTYNKPNPVYCHYTGNDAWTKDTFLSATIAGLEKDGFYFQAFKPGAHQGDLSEVENSTTSDWGLAFMLPNYLRKKLLPENLEILSRSIGRTGNRHDAYIVRKI